MQGLDEHITGNYGEDFFEDEGYIEPYRELSEDELEDYFDDVANDETYCDDACPCCELEYDEGEV